LDLGFRNLRCLVRPASKIEALNEVIHEYGDGASVEIVPANLLSKDDCLHLVEGVKVVFHLAAGRGEKSFPDAFMNSVVTTRNLLDACVARREMVRFVNMSSFAVYKNKNNPGGRLLDESAPIEEQPVLRGNSYCFAKVEQDKLLMDYGREMNIPYV